MVGYIYKITNDINQKIYIGQTTKTLEQRLKGHISDAIHGTDVNRPLLNAIRKYGAEHFKIELIEKCDSSIINEREIYWISYYDAYYTGYNAALGGQGTRLYDQNIILDLLHQGKTCSEIINIVHCGKDTVYTTAHKNDFHLTGKTIKKDNRIKQYSKLNHEYLRTFNNSHEAMQWCIQNGFSKVQTTRISSAGASHIRAVCDGKRKSAYGFYWQYE